MIYVISGSRTITDSPRVVQELYRNIPVDPSTIIRVGDARGVDSIAYDWARSNGLVVDVYKPNWNLYGNSAGPIRNKEMLAGADRLIAIWDGQSRGCGGTIKMADIEGIEITTVIMPGNE